MRRARLVSPRLDVQVFSEDGRMARDGPLQGPRHVHVDTRRLLGSAKTLIADGCALQIALQGIAEDERNGHRLATQSRVRAEAAKSRANRWAEVCKRRNLVRGPMHFGGAFFIDYSASSFARFRRFFWRLRRLRSFRGASLPGSALSRGSIHSWNPASLASSVPSTGT